jgi:hypothetical protein
MNLRFMCILAICLGVSPSAFAGQQSGFLGQISCSAVRFYVAKYSMPAAEQWARSKGATDAEIEAARRCLAPDATRTAKTQTSPLALGPYDW